MGKRGNGLACPGCGHALTYVSDTRWGNGFIRRRRSCEGCGRRVTTREVVVGGRVMPISGTALSDAVDQFFEPFVSASEGE